MASPGLDQDDIIPISPDADGVPDPKKKTPLGSEMDPKIQNAIGQALQSYYDDLVNEPLPDRLLVLLAELEAKERRGGS